MPQDLADLKIVVIEADFEMRTQIMKALRDNGARHTETFGTITQAIAYLREAAVDVIISEMDLAPIDGAGFAYALRKGKLPPNKKTPLLLIGIAAQAERIKAAIEAGANNILLKPFSPADLLKRIRVMTRIKN